MIIIKHLQINQISDWNNTEVVEMTLNKWHQISRTENKFSKDIEKLLNDLSKAEILTALLSAGV